MEMTTKPSLNTPMLPHQLNKLLTLLLIRMIQPTAPIHDVILLQDTQSAPVRRSMRKNEYLPPLLGLMSLDQIFEPIDLFLVDGDLVGGEDGITKDGGA